MNTEFESRPVHSHMFAEASWRQRLIPRLPIMCLFTKLYNVRPADFLPFRCSAFKPISRALPDATGGPEGTSVKEAIGRACNFLPPRTADRLNLRALQGKGTTEPAPKMPCHAHLTGYFAVYPKCREWGVTWQPLSSQRIRLLPVISSTSSVISVVSATCHFRGCHSILQ